MHFNTFLIAWVCEYHIIVFLSTRALPLTYQGKRISLYMPKHDYILIGFNVPVYSEWCFLLKIYYVLTYLLLQHV